MKPHNLKVGDILYRYECIAPDDMPVCEEYEITRTTQFFVWVKRRNKALSSNFEQRFSFGFLEQRFYPFARKCFARSTRKEAARDYIIKSQKRWYYTWLAHDEASKRYDKAKALANEMGLSKALTNKIELLTKF